MPTQNLSFFTLLLLISFASVNAVLFTPGLPGIANFFSISTHYAQYTISWFLVGYAVGQLIYGPIANRYGRKPALYAGVALQIISSILCILSSVFHQYPILILGRFLLAIGSGVGLKMTFTLVNECYEFKAASQKISYLMLSFAITPGLAVALGGLLTEHFGWVSCFYACLIYGLILLVFISRLPETQKTLDFDALKYQHLLKNYRAQFGNMKLMAGALLMGCCASFVYIFSAAAPFLAINNFGMNPTQYGIANILPPIGLIAGSLVSAKLINQYSLQKIILSGIILAIAGTFIMLINIFLKLSIILALFFPMIIIFFGLCFILANASTIAMSQTSDKAHGSAVMNFTNMGFATIAVLSLGLFPMQPLLLPGIYFVLCIGMIFLYRLIIVPENPYK